MAFDSFRSRLGDKDKETFDKIFKDENKNKQKLINDEIGRDRKHIEAINLCANLFSPGDELDSRTGYRLVLIEPLGSLGIKNFDLGIFNNKSRCLILVECKGSIAKPEFEVKELKKTINITLSHMIELEDVLGSKVISIEFVFCVPSIDVGEVVNEIVKQNITLCVWGFDLYDKKLRLYSKTSNSEQEIKSGRIHKDGELSSILYNGFTVKRGLLRPIQVLPSSHMCTLMIQVNEYLYKNGIIQKTANAFSYSDVRDVLIEQFGNFTQIPKNRLQELTVRIINRSQEKGVFEDLTSDILELEYKQFRLTGRQNNAAIIESNTRDNYVTKNALKSARETVISRFRNETGFTDLKSFI